MKAYLILFLLGFSTVKAQDISSTILDAKTKTPVSFANIILNSEKGVVSDGDGNFTVPEYLITSDIDSIQVTSIGYEKLSLSVKNKIDNPLYLTPKTYDLDEVFITNLNVTKIIDSVRLKAKNNYYTGLSKKKIFYKEFDQSFLRYLDIKLKKSSIKEINQEFIDSLAQKAPKETLFLVEALIDCYGDFKTQKLLIEKAGKSYDTNQNGQLEAFYTNLEKELNKHVKSDSYFKIKSGLLSFKMDAEGAFIKDGEVTDIRNDMGNKSKRENFFLNDRKETLEGVFENVFTKNGSDLNFFKDPDDFKFELLGNTHIGNQFVYVVSFKEDSSKGFEGKIYVNPDDFAVLRMDYTSFGKQRSFSLFGVSFNMNQKRGVMVFEKSTNDKYDLKFIEKKSSFSVGLDRPFKIIEKNKNVKGRRKQNQMNVDMKMKLTIAANFQVMVYDSTPSSQNEFESINESKSAQPKHWKKYETDFWNSNSKVNNFNSQVKQLKQVGEIN